MAKGNFIVGKMIGSVGDVTAYARGNDQIVRRRNRYVKNPRTQAQTINRIIAATIGSAYSRLSAIADHSFQGHSTKADNMARFLKANQGLLRSMLANAGDAFGTAAFQAIGQKGIVADPYIISEGSLPTTQVSFVAATQGGSPVPSLLVGSDGGNQYEYNEVINALNLQAGDQISFVVLSNSGVTTSVTDADAWGADTRLSFCRVILESASGDNDETFLDDTAINDPNQRNEYTGNFNFAFVNGRLTFVPKASVGKEIGIVAAAVIASRKNGSTWQRSLQQLVVNPSWANMPSLEDAVNASYPSTGAIADPSKFLNAALPSVG